MTILNRPVRSSENVFLGGDDWTPTKGDATRGIHANADGTLQVHFVDDDDGDYREVEVLKGNTYGFQIDIIRSVANGSDNIAVKALY